ncbi:hypothetical protein FisN_23Hh226 [Fistulifera solaris]|uniref:Uncharacterized protein n=1 Tax=Fistulifera solaris TaxID=1519565 RepID=A0A1Z5JWU9_FISSO|nr:hypothetical protein FisN_23Hh226 [Fistulifera solaris]|eukprot:GAX18332.1 hypothetical protein FisN_23Hh226 [Fistulifera solaris]
MSMKMNLFVLSMAIISVAQAFLVQPTDLFTREVKVAMVAEYFSLAAATIRESRDAASLDPLHAARDFDCPGFRKDKQYFPTFATIVNPPEETEIDPSRPNVPRLQTTARFDDDNLEDLHLQLISHKDNPWAKAVEYGAARIGELQAKVMGTDNPEYWLS